MGKTNNNQKKPSKKRRSSNRHKVTEAEFRGLKNEAIIPSLELEPNNEPQRGILLYPSAQLSKVLTTTIEEDCIQLAKRLAEERKQVNNKIPGWLINNNFVFMVYKREVKIKHLEKSLDETKKKYEEKTSECRRLQAENSTLMLQNAKLNNDKLALVDENKILKKKIQDLGAQITTITVKNSFDVCAKLELSSSIGPQTSSNDPSKCPASNEVENLEKLTSRAQETTKNTVKLLTMPPFKRSSSNDVKNQENTSPKEKPEKPEKPEKSSDAARLQPQPQKVKKVAISYPQVQEKPFEKPETKNKVMDFTKWARTSESHVNAKNAQAVLEIDENPFETSNAVPRTKAMPKFEPRPKAQKVKVKPQVRQNSSDIKQVPHLTKAYPMATKNKDHLGTAA